MIKLLTLLISIISMVHVSATTYWVSPNGTDSDPGSESKPFSITKGFATAQAGDIVWVKGGLYKTSATLKFSNAGTASNFIKIWAVPGEKPIIDCASFANGTSTSRGIDMKKDYCHIKGLTIQYAGYNGIAVGANGCIIEGCIIHHCEIDGLTLTNNAKNTLVLNCDSYLNWDKQDGNNGDGFSAKHGSLEGNIFRGCRAWLNSDDGWDTYGSYSPILLDSCWAFRNGFNVFGYTGVWKGNGNGFKLGADGPNNANNVMTNSIAWGNKSKGFDHNHSHFAQTIINCTGYKNKAPNFSFYDVPTGGIIPNNIMRNNISYQGTINLAPGTENVTNSWDLNLPLTDADFVSLDTNLSTIERDIYYRIPVTGLFRLKASNPAIDKGTVQNNVALRGAIPYAGKAPDLGAFEFNSNVINGLEDESRKSDLALLCFPNPTSNAISIEAKAKITGTSSLILYNAEGVKILNLFDGDLTEGSSLKVFSQLDQLRKGIYLCVFKNQNIVNSIKIIKE